MESMKSMNPLIYIILVNYNGYMDTKECLESLKKLKYGNYKIVVVDNASRDSSLELLRNNPDGYILIESSTNLGFAGGNNLGIEYALKAGAQFVLLVNNDTIVDENLLSNMLQTFEKNSKVGVVGGKILLYDNKAIISHAGGYVDMFKFTTVHYGMDKSSFEGDYNIEREVGFVSGCLMLIKREVFEKVGLLPGEYFMYYEDTDFCLRVIAGGYKIYYNPKAEIFHKVSMSSGGEDSPFFIKWNTRNRIIFMNKYKLKSGKLKFLLSLGYVYGTRVIRYFIYLFKGDKVRAGAIREGMAEGRVELSRGRG